MLKPSFCWWAKEAFATEQIWTLGVVFCQWSPCYYCSVLCLCLLSIFSSSTFFSTCSCPGCFCFSSLSHCVLLFCASGSSAFQPDFWSCFSWPRQPVQGVSIVTADTLASVFGYAASEISKKVLLLLFPGNNTLVFSGYLCVCVWGATTEYGRCNLPETLVPNPLSFCWSSGQWFLWQFRGQQGQDLLFLSWHIIVWMLVSWKPILEKLVYYTGICSLWQHKVQV